MKRLIAILALIIFATGAVKAGDPPAPLVSNPESLTKGYRFAMRNGRLYAFRTPPDPANPSNGNQVLVSAWTSANNAGYPGALEIYALSSGGGAPASNPSNGDQALVSSWSTANGSGYPGALAVYCVTGCSGGGGGGTVTSFSAGSLSPLFTSSVATATSTPALTFTLSNAAQNSVLAGPPSGGAGAPTYQTAPTISAANMTNFPTFNQSTTGNAATATDLASYTSYSIFGAGNAVKTWITPTANGQCLMSAASSYATTTPSFQTCATGNVSSSGSFTAGDFVVAQSTGSSLTLVDGGSGITLNGIQNPTGNTKLNIGTNLIEFDWTSAVAKAFILQNTTAAVVGTSQGSPQLGTCGNGFHSSASVPVCIGLSVLPGNGNDAAITVTGWSNTTSTGAITWSLPALTLSVTPLAISSGGTGTASTLTGLVRGNASAMTAAELSGDVTTSGSNAATVVQVEGAAIPTSANYVATNSSKQLVAANAPFYMFYGILTQGLAQSTTGYVVGTPGATPSTYAAVKVPLPNGGTVSNLQCSSTAAPGGTTQTITYTVVYAAQGTTTGSSSTITCQESTGGNNYCSDTSHTLSLTAGETIAFQMVTSATTGTVAAPACSVQITDY